MVVGGGGVVKPSGSFCLGPSSMLEQGKEGKEDTKKMASHMSYRRLFVPAGKKRKRGTQGFQRSCRAAASSFLQEKKRKRKAALNTGMATVAAGQRQGKRKKKKEEKDGRWPSADPCQLFPTPLDTRGGKRGRTSGKEAV